MNVKCEICQKEFETRRSLSTHLQTKHKIKALDYVIKYLYEGTRPLCPICQEETRYCTYSFKKYCKEHSRYAEVEGGKKGGKAEAWSKGKTKKDDVRLLALSEKNSGEGNPFYGKRHTTESIAKLKQSKTLSEQEFNQRCKEREKEFTVLTKYNEYFSRQHQYLDVVCAQCSLQQRKTLQAFERGSLCGKCFPFTTSKDEIELLEYVRTLESNVKHGERKLIPPKEIDIYIESKNLAIEYNGLYWHSEIGFDVFDKNYHYEKTKSCNEKNINLFHVFSDDWRDRKEIVKSMIQNKLGIAQNKIWARKCSVVEIDGKKAKEFFDSSHLSGHTLASVYFALEYEGELVACLSLRFPNHKKHSGKIEIARLATKPYCLVVGGFSKLLKRAIEWSKTRQYASIISYCDLSCGTGNVYKQNGFTHIAYTGLNFWYTDGVCRYDRFKYRAQNGKSEKEVALENKVYRIYGCGNDLYELEINLDPSPNL